MYMKIHFCEFSNKYTLLQLRVQRVKGRLVFLHFSCYPIKSLNFKIQMVTDENIVSFKKYLILL